MGYEQKPGAVSSPSKGGSFSDPSTTSLASFPSGSQSISAGDTVFVPAGGVSATDVQAAIEEVASESLVAVLDEGISLTSGVGSINFVGANVTATTVGDAVTVTVAGGGTNLGYTASTRSLTSDTGSDVTLPLVSSSDAGLAPASGGGTTNFLRADGTWTTPGGVGGGSATDITFTPVGTISATNTQAAVAEVDSEKVAKAGDTMTGALTMYETDIKFTEASPYEYYITHNGNRLSMGLTGSGINNIDINQDGSVRCNGLSIGLVGDELPAATMDYAESLLEAPAFRAMLTSLQTPAASTLVKIAFATELFDTNSCYDSTTNYRFTPNVAGYYDLRVHVAFNPSGASSVEVGISVNGSGIVSSNEYLPVGSVYQAITANAIAYFNGTTDYAETFVVSGLGSGGIDPNASFFSGHFVRRP